MPSYAAEEFRCHEPRAQLKPDCASRSYSVLTHKPGTGQTDITPRSGTGTR